MFGKTKDPAITSEQRADIVIDDFFGDEAAVAEAERIDKLHQRMTGVEQQLNSQFTSMAAYAQIAQEQIELVRSENQNAIERGEKRAISLIERERNDRLGADGVPTDGITSRLDTLEGHVGELRESLQQCLSNQKALADAITDLFTRPGAIATVAHAPADETLTTESASDAATPADAGYESDVDFETDIELESDVEPAPVAEPIDEPLEVEASNTLLPGTDNFIDDDVFGGEFTAIETHDVTLADDIAPVIETSIEPVVEAAPAPDFGMFAAPDIATVEPMASLPAPVLSADSPAYPDIPAPAADDGPIAALSLD